MFLPPMITYCQVIEHVRLAYGHEGNLSWWESGFPDLASLNL
jgi:hypothetical protein